MRGDNMIIDFFKMYKKKFKGCTAKKYPNTIKKEMRLVLALYKIAGTIKTAGPFDCAVLEDIQDTLAKELSNLGYADRRDQNNVPQSQLLPKIHAAIIT